MIGFNKINVFLFKFEINWGRVRNKVKGNENFFFALL